MSKLTGWSPKYLSKIRARWDQMSPQGNHRRIGEPPAPVKAVEISPMRDSVIGHTEKLLKVFEDFRNIEQFALHDTDLATWWSRPDEPSWPVPKGRAWREVRGSLRVKFDAASPREWSYLQQHLVDDPVWGAIEHCHEALADDLAARLKLLDRIAALVQQREERGGLGLPMGADPANIPVTRSEVTTYCVFTLHHQVLFRSLGMGLAPKRREEFEYHDAGYPEVISLGGRPVVRSVDTQVRSRAIEFLLQAQEKMAELQEAVAASEAYRAAEASAGEANNRIADVLLMPGLPPDSACDLCERWARASLRSP